MSINDNDEQNIFNDLEALCTQQGFAHVIAYFCLDSNLVKYRGTIKSNDFLPMYSDDRLLRTEITTLIGLMLKGDLKKAVLKPTSLLDMIKRTESLLEKLHESLAHPLIDETRNPIHESFSHSPFSNGITMREPIFYAGESAYSFQHLQFFIRRYIADNLWIKTTKGFDIHDAVKIIKTIQFLQFGNLKEHIYLSKKKIQPSYSILPALVISIDEIILESGCSKDVVKNVLDAFSISRPQSNNEFCSLKNFNIVNAKPIIRLNEKDYLLFQYYCLTQSLYESPFFWFKSDQKYFEKAMINRGHFTEKFSADRFSDVFGKGNVYKNLKIFNSNRNDALGEIDVLVIFVDRLIVLQAKSKRLTYEARTGNDQALKNDFKKSIQDAYDQAYECSEYLLNAENEILLPDGKTLKFNKQIKEIFIVCILSEQYPALSLQSRSFLNYRTTDIIRAPYITDVFIFDVLCEMLDSPLYLLSYLDRRSKFYDELIAESELSILAYHIRTNLWVKSGFNIYLDDDFCTDIDVTMSARREGLPGARTPEGILTRYKNTSVGQIIKAIEECENLCAIELGLFLLQLSEDSIAEINRGIDVIASRASTDGFHHDFSLLVDKSYGISVHCSYLPDEIAMENLRIHCETKKYSQKSNHWFGICIAPNNKSLRFAIELNFEWEESCELKSMSDQFLAKNLVNKVGRTKEKIGRNDPCSCGSGQKFKKCCGAAKFYNPDNLMNED